ncbi:MAG: polysaccharide deacetylase family protein [Gammaproteobacteria bacterium]|nr:polysaccharide deacetylase family protein [Gammaproteobacteria bacterium]
MNPPVPPPVPGPLPDPAAPGDSAVILQYHFVAEDTPAVTSVSPERFRAHLEHLAEHDFNILPLPELIERLRAGEELPPRAAAITFDDGYISVYENAFPMLRERGWPFTVFVNSAAHDAPGRSFASWDQLREMQEHGATIANHSVNHAYLARASALEEESEADFRARMEREIDAAEARIEEKLGVSHKLFAYPFGEYDDRIRAWIAEHGYVGIGQHSGAVWAGSDFSALPRFPFSGDYSEMESFSEKIRMAPLPVLDPEQLPDQTLATSEPRPELSMRVATQGIREREIACYATAQGRMETTIEPLDDGSVRVGTRAAEPVHPGRSRYNCTAPRSEGGWTWFSHPWLRVMRERADAAVQGSAASVLFLFQPRHFGADPGSSRSLKRMIERSSSM